MKMYTSENQIYKKRWKSRKFNEKNFWITRKSYEFQEKTAMPFIPENNVRKALISIEHLRQM